MRKQPSRRGIPHISQEKLKSLLHYDPETGVFTWLNCPALQIQPGTRAGTDSGSGYRYICVFGRLYGEHRLAWLYVYGWLPNKVDHDDGDGFNNQVKNLRPCTVSQNNCNKAKLATNKSGFKGVSWHKASSKWTAQIQMSGKKRYLGVFDTSELAHEFYCLAADMIHGEFSNHGTHKCAIANT